MNDGTHRGRDIPWLPIVRFHQDVVARAEAGFFSLNAKDDQAERWTSLPNFNPTDLAGPWTIERDDLHSQPFRLALEQGNHSSIFLGGPGYLGFDRPFPNAGWVAQWRPLLYREVEVKQEGSSYILTPKSGTWSVTPLMYSQLDRLEITLDRGLEDIAAAMIEKAAAIRDLEQAPLSEAVISSFIREIPAIEDTLTRKPKPRDFNVTPSPWMLFAPVNEFSALIRQLMADYERLVERLEKNPSDIGGLELLEDNQSSETNTHANSLPLIPLNSSQDKAVQRVLSGAPLSVISGPPGTGKSQVVVSLLLNAWAEGKTVLFASNNNKAVDVVRERVEQYESEFPIAVRAGSRAKQNVREVLRRTLNMASSGDGNSTSAASATRLRKAQQKLKDKREQLESDLKSKLPQRIDEAKKTAIEAYATHRRSLADMEAREQELDSQATSLGLSGMTLGQAETCLSKTDDWLSAIQETLTQIRDDETTRSQARATARICIERRNHAAASVGLSSDENTDWRWLIAGPSPDSLTSWLTKATGLLDQQLESTLEDIPWHDSYEQWPDSTSATNWKTAAISFIETGREHLAKLGPKLQAVQDIAHERGEQQAVLKQAGIPIDVDISTATIDSWNSSFSNLTTRTPHWSDWIPWSTSGRLLRNLKAIEADLRGHLPVAIWRELGPLDNNARGQLSDLLALIENWQKIQTKWNSAQTTLQEIENTFTSMRSHAGRLGLADIPTSPEVSAWETTLQVCKLQSDSAAVAATAWAKREDKVATEKMLQGLAKEWQGLASGFPLREAWQTTRGKAFDNASNSLRRSPDIASLHEFRKQMYTGVVQELQTAWNGAYEAHQQYLKAEKEESAVPSESARIASWLNMRPKKALGPVPDDNDWPSFDELNQALTGTRQFLKNWRTFIDVNRPEQEKDAAEELEWALARLIDARKITPATNATASLDTIIDQIQKSPESDWPVEQLNMAFLEFSPEKIRAEIDGIDAQLKRGSFEDAKARWIERLQDDEGSVRAVDTLERLMGKRSVANDSDHPEAFRNALRSVPIWITTAQAAQAIPLEPKLFDLVVIDEASQCTLTNLLPLVYRGKSLAVIGDDQQLPAIPNIQESEQNALAKKHDVLDYMSLLGHANNDVYKTASASLPRRRADVHTLNEHFRSHPQIIGFSNRHIYLQRLELKKDPQWGKRLPVGSGVCSEQVSGHVTRGKRGRSWVNQTEADRVIEIVKHIKEGDSRQLSLGIVTPFAAHKDYLREQLDAAGLLSQVLADTAYGFQGDERDVIIFSPVLSKGITSSASRWVETPPNLINVALTRARELLYVVGDLDYCSQQEGILRKLAVYCREIETLRKESPAELELFSWMVVKGWVPEVHPTIGDIEPDFVLQTDSGLRIAIEVDGNQHDYTKEQDKARDAYLQAQGYKVYRPSARAIFETPFDVIHQIETLVN